jgi:ABC-type thiamin/hydroxymethylpyrimidine transport system permease subunit
MSLWQKLVITILTMLVAGFVAGLIWGNIFDVTMPSYLAGMVGGMAAILIWELLKKVVIRESMLSKWSLSFMLITIIALYFIVGVHPDALVYVVKRFGTDSIKS